jgi:hypothetical protein
MLLNQFGAEGNCSAKKAAGTAEIRGIWRFLAGREREGRGSFLRGFVIGGLVAVRAAGAAFLGAGAERFVDDRLDRARAPAAFGAAAEATVNLFWIARQVRGCAYGTTDIVVAQNVAGTDDHETETTLVMRPHRYLSGRRDAKGKAAFSSNSKLMPEQILE